MQNHLWFRTLYPQSRSLFETLSRDPALGEYLHALEYMDHEIYLHSERVCLLSLDLGMENGVGEPEIRHLGSASLLHDIGKTRLPRDLLTKAESLDREEFRLVRGHVRLGFIALADMQPETIKEVVVAHHEFSDHPYPRSGQVRGQLVRTSADRRRSKPAVRRLTEIVAVADMADALASKRAYKEVYSKESISRILRSEFRGDALLVEQVLRRQR
jgi:HD-GYP domain-containing protein (c-di-GMP phosphodiesterase class II)